MPIFVCIESDKDVYRWFSDGELNDQITSVCSYFILEGVWMYFSHSTLRKCVQALFRSLISIVKGRFWKVSSD
jgi:hypothetical protein